jgi:acyl-coenzyme A thioesterase PaaI-like protein
MQREQQALQDRYAPQNRCFGCGPANNQGLRIKSFVEHHPAEGSSPAHDELVAEFTPAPHHLAFEGVLNGGIVGALLDCHSNWTAAHRLMVDRGETTPPCTVTSEFTIKLKRPTPLDTKLVLRAHVSEASGDRCVVDATLEANGKVTATCHGTFVAVKEGHPAFHRW